LVLQRSKYKTVSPWSLPWIRENCFPNFPGLCFQDWPAWHHSVPGFHPAFFPIKHYTLNFAYPSWLGISRPIIRDCFATLMQPALLSNKTCLLVIEGVFIRKLFLLKGHCMLLRGHVLDRLLKILAQKRQIFNK
jgi:hypothetical protein